MKKYEYVSLHIRKVLPNELTEHREIIDKYAELGYRYAGFVPTYIDEHGILRKIDLVFEIEY